MRWDDIRHWWPPWKSLPAEPPAVPKTPSLYVHMVVRKTDGTIPEHIRGEMGTNDWTVVGSPISYYMLEFWLPPGVEYGSRASIKIEGDDCQPLLDEIELAADINVELQPEAPPARAGVMHVSGKLWHDDSGACLPLGTTLFWAVGGWHRHDRDRVKQNLSYIKQNGFDYVRVLGQVAWPGEEIDPRWPDYRDTLASFIDCAYDEYGLRVQLTAIGGGSPDPVSDAQQMHNVVSMRRHKLVMLEAVNEGNASAAEATEIAKLFAPLQLPCGTGLGDQGIDAIQASSNVSNANARYLHTERSGDNARQVRQCWDFHLFSPFASVDNEPPGPASSVQEQKDPFVLACLRAGAIICGAGAFCFHTGSGVFGRTYPYGSGFRYANLWEVPNMDAMMRAVKNAGARLPADVPTWSAFNTNHPVDTPAGNVNKLYGAIGNGQFTEIAIAADGPLTLRARRPCTFDVINVAEGTVHAHASLQTNQTITVSGLWSYVLVGTL